MKRRFPWVMAVPLVIFVMLAATLALALWHNGQTSKFAMHMDEPVPATILPVMGDSAVSFNPQDWLGRVYIVNFFASWCVQCHAEHEELMHIAEQKIPIIGIALEDKQPALLHFLATDGNPFLLIADDAKGRAVIDWGLTGVPETFLVDAKGIIRYHYVGPMTDKIVDDQLMPLWRSLAP